MRSQLAEQWRNQMQDISIYVLFALAFSSVSVKPIEAEAEEK